MVEHTGSRGGSVALTCGNYRNETGTYSNLKGENTTGVRAAAHQEHPREPKPVMASQQWHPVGGTSARTTWDPKFTPVPPGTRDKRVPPGLALILLWIENTGTETLAKAGTQHDLQPLPRLPMWCGGTSGSCSSETSKCQIGLRFEASQISSLPHSAGWAAQEVRIDNPWAQTLPTHGESPAQAKTLLQAALCPSAGTLHVNAHQRPPRSLTGTNALWR